MTYSWQGTIRRDPSTGGIVGELRDTLGFCITLTGERCEGGYALVGVPGDVPNEYRIPLLDDEKATNT